MKIFLIVLGIVTLGLGALGAALPILPTTPFLLVSAFCFARSSDRLNNWFKGTKLYKNNLESFVRGQGMTKKTKLKIMATVTILMAIGFLCMKETSVGRICLAVVWVAHILAFCFFIKTCPENAARAAEESADDVQ